MDKYIVTPEVLREGLVSRVVLSGEVRGRVYVPWTVIKRLESEFHNEIVKERVLKELSELRRLSEEKLIDLALIDISNATSDIYHQILNLSLKDGATILLVDEEKALLLSSLGAKVKVVKKPEVTKVDILSFMSDENIMSLHLKEGTKPKAKKGRPGEWKFVEISDKVLTKGEMEEYIEELMALIKQDRESFIEVDGKGLTIVQLKDYRVVISRPPFSDGYEITVARPIKKLSLYEYNLPPALIERFKNRAEGILIAGAPGAGKSTFCQALAEFYRELGKVVKTIESPRDLQVSKDITQYSKNYASVEELYSVILLSRPDYTIFDEMRTTEDFKLYIDLRLAGIGLVGVTHAARPIDAIQRFVERVDVGLIPSILDTVIYLEKGEVKKVYEISMSARPPYGLKEDLSRPVVEVRDFFTKEVEYEFYVFGSKVFAIPVGRHERGARVSYGGEKQFAEEIVKRELGDVEEMEIRVLSERDVLVLVPPWSYKQLRKAFENKARRIRKKYGIRVSIEPTVGLEE